MLRYTYEIVAYFTKSEKKKTNIFEFHSAIANNTYIIYK